MHKKWAETETLFTESTHNVCHDLLSTRNYQIYVKDKQKGQDITKENQTASTTPQHPSLNTTESQDTLRIMSFL